MVLTRESPRARWAIMGATWILVAWLAAWHSRATQDYVTLLDSVGRPAQETPLQRPLPGSFADAQTWVRFALSLQEGGGWQLRHTDIDNAPYGRDVHWSSVFAHLVSAAGRIEQKFTGAPLPRATENALAWFNLPLLLACVIPLSAWAAARAGAGAGVLLACGMVGQRSFYDAFFPNYVDHHGILNASALAVVLGVLFMGAGWWRTEDQKNVLLPASLGTARRAAIVSALAGAIGMWISAASTIPVIALSGIASLAATATFGKNARADGAVFDPGVWRLWGRVGAVASVVFYAIEYFPGHLSWRLEVNHPFHALAWWAGGELIATLALWRVEGAAARPRLAQILPPLAGFAAAPLTVILGGPAAFAVRDPFVGELRHLVAEGMSFAEATRSFGSEYAQRYIIDFVLLVAAVWMFVQVRRERLLVGIAAGVYGAFVALSCWENRWWLTASGPFLCVCLVMVAVIGTGGRSAGARWTAVLGFAAVLLPTGAFGGARLLRDHVRTRTVDAADVLHLIYRDIASTLRATHPQGEIILLADPDASAAIGYYGRIRTIGTLYWENTPGLKAAAAIFSARDDNEARRLIAERGITHLAMVIKGNFVKEYFELLHPEARKEDVEQTFGHRLFVQQQIPRWLRLIPYQSPPKMVVGNLGVMLLEVVPEQNEFDFNWNTAIAQLTGGRSDEAEIYFRQAIALAASSQQAVIYQKAADLAGAHNALALAIRFYRAALALAPNPHSAGELAWLLSTTSDATLRNGREALALVEPIVQTNANDLVVLNAFAGALAENGRFKDAFDIATHAAVIARNAGDARVAAILQQRADTYRSGRPWRQ